MKWITREPPTIDCLAFPQLVTLVIDEDPKFLPVPAKNVLCLARQFGAVLTQAAGLLAASLGRCHNFRDDRDMLCQSMVIYDALYKWCRSCRSESHGWPPKSS